MKVELMVIYIEAYTVADAAIVARDRLGNCAGLLEVNSGVSAMDFEAFECKKGFMAFKDRQIFMAVVKGMG